MRIAAIEYELGSVEQDLETLGAENPEWRMDSVFEKTGVAKLHISAPGETALSLATAAGRKLLSGRDATGIAALIYVTQSPDSLIPTSACLLHRDLGLPETCLAFDLNQGCSGFVYGLSMAQALLDAQGLSEALVVCAETYSKHIAADDRTNRPIFSDGASAVLLQRDGPMRIGPFVYVTDGRGAPNLTLRPAPGGGEELFMNGPQVLLFTMGAVPRAVRELLSKAALRTEDVDLFVFHQASRIVLDNLERNLALPPEKVYRNYEQIGNTVSATIPIALRQALDEGRLRPGMTVVLMGFGVGYSLAGCVLRT